jgi:hypothetical protein
MIGRRPIRLREAYAGLRNNGCGWFTSAFLAVIWWLGGVEIEE